MSGLLRQLAFSALLGCLGAGLGVKNVIPPSEGAGVVADETLVVYVVVFGTGPEREEVVQAPWEFITRVGIDSLEKTHSNPNIDSENVQVMEDHAPEDGRADGSDAKEENFDG